eukprot:TRINITY_DN5964_c0_g1_i1.p1 TRINITY_DN5964_c0_g1~~TRINITY_DN5964_c0_g1_i1.p1  ORF type:complete len:161 (+),score=22.54 TRINITY_DN5964_c0_g1_i1:100-582(+)
MAHDGAAKQESVFDKYKLQVTREMRDHKSHAWHFPIVGYKGHQPKWSRAMVKPAYGSEEAGSPLAGAGASVLHRSPSTPAGQVGMAGDDVSRISGRSRASQSSGGNRRAPGPALSKRSTSSSHLYVEKDECLASHGILGYSGHRPEFWYPKETRKPPGLP